MSNDTKKGNRATKMGPGGGMGRGVKPPVEKAKDFKGTIKKLLEYLGKYKISIVIVLIFAIASTIFMILGPKILGNATTEIFEGVMRQMTGAGEGINFGAIGSIMITLIILYVISAVFSFIQGWVMTGVSNKLTYRLRREINEKIHRLPFKYYDKTTTGEVLSRITNDVDVINQSFSQSITQIITSITSIIGIVIMMFTINWQMTLIALATLPTSFAIIAFIIKKSQKYFLKQQEYLGKVNSNVEEYYSSYNIVKVFNGEERTLNRFKEDNEILYHSAWKANFLSGLMMPIMNFIGNLGYVLVVIVGGYYATKQRIAVGDIQAFIQYMRQFTQPIAQLSQISNVLQQTVAASERVFEFLEEEESKEEKEDALEIVNDTNKGKANAVEVVGDVTFEHVAFGYDKDRLVINDFNASVKAGQKIAIVGPTGAGKTTMVKLLMRFYELNSGRILLDKYDTKEFKKDELRTLFGMVLQETWLYNGSIKDNIKYGKLDATDEEVIEAAKAAQVNSFVNTLPSGYNMILNEEASNLSQGQKQLITIARAILADPKILILDEATSSVDTRTEVLIQKAMDNLMKGRTSFIIAHRLSTIQNADLILVMNNGDIIEQGTHEELLEKNGFYANLYNSQFSEEEE